MKFLYTRYPKQYGFMLNFITFITQPFKIILLKSGFNIFFGGKEQDKWVAQQIFNFKKDGYFIDLAATDGITDNNTYFLENRLDWKGICIEPNQKYFKKLMQNRKSIKLNEVISYIDGEEVDFIFNKGIGGIIGDQYDNNFEKRKDLINKNTNLIKKVKTKTLETILIENKSPKIIDYLSLDVEGAEFDVFKNFNFNNFKILSLTIERPSKQLNELLLKNNYLFVKNFKVDTFYIHKDLQEKINIKLEKFEQVPPKKW